MPSLKRCNYCGHGAKRVTGAQLFPHLPRLADKVFYRCDGCDAHVGCHPGTSKPLGRLANKALRMARTRAHAAFDPIWRDGHLSRAGAYAWLARELKMQKTKCHIALFEEDESLIGAWHDMTGHPHKGKRSKWRSLFNDYPDFGGDYEWRCKKRRLTVIRVIRASPFVALLDGEILFACDKCQWRGLAEEPE